MPLTPAQRAVLDQRLDELDRGDEFLEVVQSALDRILEFPLTSPIVHRDARRCLMERFPYCVFYRMGAEPSPQGCPAVDASRAAGSAQSPRRHDTSLDKS